MGKLVQILETFNSFQPLLWHLLDMYLSLGFILKRTLVCYTCTEYFWTWVVINTFSNIKDPRSFPIIITSFNIIEILWEMINTRTIYVSYTWISRYRNNFYKSKFWNRAGQGLTLRPSHSHPYPNAWWTLIRCFYDKFKK